MIWILIGLGLASMFSSFMWGFTEGRKSAFEEAQAMVSGILPIVDDEPIRGKIDVICHDGSEHRIIIDNDGRIERTSSNEE